MILEYEYMQSKDDLREINKFTLLKRYPLWLIGMAVSVYITLMIGIGSLRIGINGLRFGGDTLASLLYLFVAFIILIYIPVNIVRGMKRIEKDKNVQEPVKLFLDEDIFTAVFKEQKFECTYENFTGVFETQKYFFLMLPRQRAVQPLYFIRKSDITPEISDRLRNFFTEKFGRKFKKY